MTVVRCPICGNSAKVDEELQGGEQLDCPYCNRTFTYGRKKDVSTQEVRPANSAPQRVDLPSAGGGTPIQQASNTANRDSNDALQSSLCVMKRAKVIIQKALSKKYLRIWAGVVCVIAIVCVVGLVRSKGERSPADFSYFSSLFDKMEKAEAKYGTNSIEYIEARLDFVRNIEMKIETVGARKHREFLDMLDKSAYIVTYYEYDDETLSYLVVLNKYTGANGIMSAGLQKGQFNYPRWMPIEDARLIWEHYSYKGMVNSERNLEEHKKLVNELEMRLQQLKNQR